MILSATLNAVLPISLFRMAILFVSHKSPRKTPLMKRLELQCSPLKPPFKIPTALPHPPSALYLSSHLYPYLSYLRSYLPISCLRSLALYPNHVERDRSPHRRIFSSPPLPTSFTRTERFHPAVSASSFLGCSQECQRRTRDPSWDRDADDRYGGMSSFLIRLASIRLRC